MAFDNINTRIFVVIVNDITLIQAYDFVSFEFI